MKIVVFLFCKGTGDQSPLRFIYGIRGRKKLVVDHYSFYRFSNAKQSQMWYCSQRKPLKCRASIKLYMNGKWNIVVGDHNHLATKLYAPMHHVKDIRDIYYDDTSALPSNIVEEEVIMEEVMKVDKMWMKYKVSAEELDTTL